jgi:hypothetical protein
MSGTGGLRAYKKFVVKKHTTRHFEVFGFAALAMFACLAGSLAAPPTNLRCEYLTDPLGIESTRPRLSWVIESARRGERQTAYQVLLRSCRFQRRTLPE